MDEELQTAKDSLEDLLDAERAALLVGNLDDVARLHSEKERLIDALKRATHDDRDQLAALSDKVARNQALLDSALEGIRSVTRRLSAIRQVRKSLETYDSFGKRQTVDIRTGGSVERRA